MKTLETRYTLLCEIYRLCASHPVEDAFVRRLLRHVFNEICVLQYYIKDATVPKVELASWLKTSSTTESEKKSES